MNLIRVAFTPEERILAVELFRKEEKRCKELIPMLWGNGELEYLLRIDLLIHMIEKLKPERGETE